MSPSQTFSIPAYLAAVAAGSFVFAAALTLGPIFTGGPMSPRLLLFMPVVGMVLGTLLGLPIFLPWTLACVYLAKRWNWRTRRHAAALGTAASLATWVSLLVIVYLATMMRSSPQEFRAAQLDFAQLLGWPILIGSAGAVAGLTYWAVDRAEAQTRSMLF